jgi:hypothetical protein
MARRKKLQTKICTVTGLETGATKDQLQRMFQQINAYV